MSMRVGHLMRHEDVHGVSGEGKVAEVFEASNGKCVVFWISSTPSVVVFDSIKALEVPHRHGGKTEVIWDWESPLDPDPMDALKKDDTDKPELSPEEIEEIAAGAAADAQKKVVDLIATKMQEPGEVEGAPEKEDKPAPKKKAAAKKAAKKKPE